MFFYLKRKNYSVAVWNQVAAVLEKVQSPPKRGNVCMAQPT